MPDWFYRTVSQPVLFRLSATSARDLALGFMGTLSRLPLGPLLIALHYTVGYLSFKHLLPAFGGFALLLIGLLLSYPFLCRKHSEPL